MRLRIPVAFVSMTAALAMVGAAVMAPSAHAALGLTDNFDGSFTVTDMEGAPDEILYICPTTVAAANCNSTNASFYFSFSIVRRSQTFTTRSTVLEDRGAGAVETALPDGTFNISIGSGDPTRARLLTLSNVVVGTGGGGGGGGTSAATNQPILLPPVEHTLTSNANGGTCTLTSSGLITDGVWIKVPSAEQCSRPGFTLLGWNPKPDGSDPLGFDPGGWTLMTDDNVLYAIWVPVR
jgi:hypothetical protein